MMFYNWCYNKQRCGTLYGDKMLNFGISFISFNRMKSKIECNKYILNSKANLRYLLTYME